MFGFAPADAPLVVQVLGALRSPDRTELGGIYLLDHTLHIASILCCCACPLKWRHSEQTVVVAGVLCEALGQDRLCVGLGREDSHALDAS